MVGKALEGKYVYCMGRGEACKEFGNVGVEESRVYALSSSGITAVLHDCPPEPYDSKDTAKVTKWLEAHNRVIELAMQEFGCVVPFRFDTIFKPAADVDAAQALVRWMREKSGAVKETLKRLEGRREYGVQIYCDALAIEGKITGLEDVKLKTMQSSPGTAYLYRQKLDGLVAKNALEIADSYSKQFFSAVKKSVSEVSVLEKKNDEGKLMIANFACLASDDEIEKLGGELEKIRENGFEVRFTGPWPPYNFVGGKIK